MALYNLCFNVTYYNSDLHQEYLLVYSTDEVLFPRRLNSFVEMM